MAPAQCKHVVAAVCYILFQVFRLVCLAMFTIFMLDCTVYHSQTSVNCNINYTIYKHVATPSCGAYCWKGLWIGCSCFTSIIVLCLVCIPSELVEPLRPAQNMQVIISLLRKQYFWYLNFILGLIILYDGIIIASSKVTSGSYKVEMGVIISKVLTTCLIYQLNFTYPPSLASTDSYPLVHVSYYMTLFVFVLDNFCKFTELSIRVSYKLYTVNIIHEVKQTEVLILMLEIVDASLYHHFLSFFWNKIFRGKSDVLLTYSPDIVQSLDAQRYGYQNL
ncbi:uncharacterized protein LOC116299080 [Actinia tenebrosa]|uniref:Uncharacterized protein LOC116299080 n=1 Tax=Actinia tenebrosa TaxID=6105 RepID=A0A6P8I6H7_ACTTE|nr:uncharacterized protein LOC116299080 [Actinia tenebrosa]